MALGLWLLGGTFDELGNDGLRHGQPVRPEVVAQEVEAPGDPTDEGRVGVLGEPERIEPAIDDRHRLAQQGDAIYITYVTTASLSHV
jgi:hypothetical protein